MQVDNKLFDDLARVASGAMGAISGIRGEVEGQIRQQFERILAQMDVVSREEFEAVKAVAAEARARQEALEEKLAALEAKLSKDSEG
ncbi:MAG: accessory factor UbiK family protein [Niveispirillum sp.]|uniref:accessory factor UbiK family protein n=1 Tax=Niveispirillum sp. TaxID=1917217 RepID=UPI003BA75382